MVESADLGIARAPSHPVRGVWSHRPSHLAPKAEVAGIRNHVVLAADLSLPVGNALIDMGAGEDLIGRSAFTSLQQQLSESGLKTVVLLHTPRTARGIGCKSTPVPQVSLPLFIGGVPGIMEVTLISDDIPHILSVGGLGRPRNSAGFVGQLSSFD